MNENEINTGFGLALWLCIFIWLVWALNLAAAFAMLLFFAVHEFGHYVAAKRQGIFERFGFFQGNLAVFTKGPYKGRWFPLAGLAANVVTMPIYIVAIPLPWIFIPVLIVIAGSYDIIYCVRPPS